MADNRMNTYTWHDYDMYVDSKLNRSKWSYRQVLLKRLGSGFSFIIFGPPQTSIFLFFFYNVNFMLNFNLFCTP